MLFLSATFQFFKKGLLKSQKKKEKARIPQSCLENAQRGLGGEHHLCPSHVGQEHILPILLGERP
jgi:hypothetical protein